MAKPKIISVDELYKLAENSNSVAEMVDRVEQLNRRDRTPPPPAPEGGITLSEAQRLYGISHSTLSRWASSGYVRVIRKDKWQTWLDEEQLKEVIKAYRKDPGKGKWTVKQKVSQAAA